MHLDNRTLAIVALFTALFLGILGLLISKTRRTYPGFGRWTAGNLAMAVYLLLFGFRGLMPDFLSLVCANAIAILAAILFLEGIREFCGLRARHWPAVVGGGLIFAAVIYFHYVTPNIGARVLALSLYLSMLGVLSAKTLLMDLPAGRRLGLLVTTGSYLFFGLLQLIRGVYVYVHGSQGGPFYVSPFNTIFSLGSVIIIVGWSFGFLIMTTDRLIVDLREAERRTAATNQQLGQAMERVQAAATEATRADAAKSEFLSSVSHEIRTPMNGVIGMTALLLDTGLTSEQRDYVETIAQSGESLLTIINDLLDLSKIEAGKLVLENLEFNTGQTILDVVKLLSPRANAKGIGLHCHGLEKLPGYLTGDPVRLQQIVTNLVGNAIKFTEEGEVLIGVRAAEWSQERLWADFEVSDTGIGMNPEVIQRLFQPFIQADDSIARKYGGTGLGLAIVKSLISMMGGEICVASEPGRGSTFSFRIPFGEARQPQSDAKTAAMLV